MFDDQVVACMQDQVTAEMLAIRQVRDAKHTAGQSRASISCKLWHTCRGLLYFRLALKSCNGAHLMQHLLFILDTAWVRHCRLTRAQVLQLMLVVACVAYHAL